MPRHALTLLNGRRRQDARVVRRPVSAFIHMSQLSALASKYPALCDCLYRPSPGRQEFHRVWQWPAASSAICPPTYSDYMVEKTHVPRIGSKFIRAKFRTNFGYMSFYNHVTTVRGWTKRARSGRPLPYPVGLLPGGT